MAAAAHLFGENAIVDMVTSSGSHTIAHHGMKRWCTDTCRDIPSLRWGVRVGRLQEICEGCEGESRRRERKAGGVLI